ncbi:MAG: class III extradiol ring-cleavage dioxygenase [Candidatus Dactylopiibacterium sp.]|nr:class III extradiol ring-cleavage dioxygenase [Candidatus Dactylopiibacterium sp.]
MNVRQPVLFVSHGSPMHAIEPSAAAVAWASEAATLAAPAAILMVSAHWESQLPLLGAAAQPDTIHDFGGFPEALYRLRYPAAGAPAVARRALELLRAAGIDAGLDATRGLDHGAWVPLLKMWPEARVPVFQLSVQPGRDAAHHLALGRALAALREEGVLIVGSGHMTHNLRDWMLAWRGVTAEPYAEAFRDWVGARLLAGDTEGLLEWERQAPHARRAHPTPEHFLPLFVALGAGEGVLPRRFHDSLEQGVLAMDAWRWD